MAVNTSASNTSVVEGGGAPARYPLPSRALLLLVAIVAGVLGSTWNLLAGYWGGTDLTRQWLADHQSAWIASTYGTALEAMGLAAVLVAVCVLVRGRGAAWATVSLATGTVGLFLYAVSSAMQMQLLGLGKQTVISADQTVALLDYLHKHDTIQAGVAFPGFLLLLVAQVAITVALFRSRVLPIWVPIVFIVGAVLRVALSNGGVVSAVAAIPQAAAMVAIGGPSTTAVDGPVASNGADRRYDSHSALGFVDEVERGLGGTAEAGEAGVGHQLPDGGLAGLRAQGVPAVLGQRVGNAEERGEAVGDHLVQAGPLPDVDHLVSG